MLPRVAEESVVFRTSRDEIAVPAVKATELVSWLRERADGRAAADAIENRRPAGVAFTEEQKSVVLSELDARGMMQSGFDVLGELNDLRYELMRDLRVPPFDD
jgi:hypothetical protein